MMFVVVVVGWSRKPLLALSDCYSSEWYSSNKCLSATRLHASIPTENFGVFVRPEHRTGGHKGAKTTITNYKPARMMSSSSSSAFGQWQSFSHNVVERKASRNLPVHATSHTICVRQNCAATSGQFETFCIFVFFFVLMPTTTASQPTAVLSTACRCASVNSARIFDVFNFWEEKKVG